MNKEQQLIYNELVSKYNFNKEQKFQIEVGLQKNLDNLPMMGKLIIPSIIIYQRLLR